MKKINELKSERTDLIEKMQGIVTLAETEKRSKTEEEGTNWTSHNTRIEAIDAEVKVLERQEELNKSVVKKNIVTPEEKVTKRYDLSKAIREASKGGLTGLEKEMNDEKSVELRGQTVEGNVYIPSFLLPEARANEETKTTGLAAGHIPLDVHPDSGVVAPRPFYREIGATVLENLVNGKLDIPFSTGHVGVIGAEGSALTQSVPTETKGTLTAKKYGGYQNFTPEYLAEQALMPQVLADMVTATDRGISNALAVAISDANIDTAAGTEAALTWATTLGLIAGLDSDNFVKEGFLMSKAVFYFLAATDKSTSTADFIVRITDGQNRGHIAGIPAYGTTALTDTSGAYQVAYGDMSKSYVGLWGGMSLLVNPYASDAYTKISFSRIADVTANTLAFISNQNVAAV